MTPRPAHYDFSGRVALVTGAAGGFGTAITARLKAAGAIPVLWDLAPAIARLPDDPSCTMQAVDITDEDNVAKAAHAVERQFGRLDILINNAGIVADVMPTWDMPPALFRRIIDVNLIGAFLTCRALVPLMIRTAASSKTGRIVSVASIQAKEGMHGAAAYSAAKAGLVAMTKALGKELADKHVLANAITPAASLTAMSIDAPKERLADILSRIPMGRFLETDEVAAQVMWLCSTDCSFATGAVFDLSGGRATY
jgi:NAD(P)-dependent dehydrogenase (short-subunit alcohol dehydrogenase family)